MTGRKVKIIFLLLFIMVLVVGCEKDESKQTIDEDYESKYPFDTRLAIIEGEDGWVHHFICEYDRDSFKPLMYYYDAYNLKYKQLDDYVIEIVDEDGVVEDIAYPSVPYMMLYNDYIDDYMNMDTFFNGNHPLEKLEEKDVETLELEYIDKKLVVDLFNTAIESDIMENGKYYNMPEADIVQGPLEDGYLWQVGYFNVHGVIVSVNIELLYEDGTYLSDIVAEGKADVVQRVVSDMISDIEEHIISNQSLIIEDNIYDRVEEKSYNRLKTLLQEIEGGVIIND